MSFETNYVEDDPHGECRFEIERLQRWKSEALPLLTKYDDIAESVGCPLGASKVDNLAEVVAKLRVDKAELLAACERVLLHKRWSGAMVDDVREVSLLSVMGMLDRVIAAAKEGKS